MNIMEQLSNMAVRDIETVIHPYTNLATHREQGPFILEEGKGIYVYDDKGKPYIEGLAGLWCTSLGYGNEELVSKRHNQRRCGACPTPTFSAASPTTWPLNWRRS